MSHTEQVHGERGEWLGTKTIWVDEVPCRRYDKKLDKWVALDYDPRDSV